MFLEDNTNIVKDSQRIPKPSRRLNSSEDKVIKKCMNHMDQRHLLILKTVLYCAVCRLVSEFKCLF